MPVSPRPFAEADVHAFVDGQMDFDRRAAFMQAMSTDSDLQARVDGWRRQNDALTSTFGTVVAEPVPVRLMPTSLNRDWRGASTKSAPSDQGTAPAAGTARRRRLGPVAIAFAGFLAGGAATIAAGSAGLMPLTLTAAYPVPPAAVSNQRGLPLRAYEAHRTYATDLNHPVEVGAADEPHLLKWVQHRLAMPVRIPDLRREGWTLLGGRVLPGDLGPAAFLLYGNGIDRLGLYMARTNLPQADGYTLYDDGTGVASVAYWVDEPVGYAITTSRDSAWLQRNGPALFKSIRAQARDNASAL
ncbi:MAG TPA: anti-sigma factor [Lichenihabitans sp.]|jgi:anti-sigma factor RsiW|nr:anti-sigma factor [Lichenihabitans sp.]